MSGHSHAKTVKRVKEAAAAQRSKIFGKFANELTVAAREGADPATNPQLRAIIEKAHKVNMPSVNVERAIARGTGQEGSALLEVLVEGYGPGGVALLVQGITDNKNRTLGEFKQILERKGGKLVGEGQVRWMFERKGVITLEPERQPLSGEALELAAIEAGAEETRRHEDGTLDVYAALPALNALQEALLKQGLSPNSPTLDWVAKEQVAVSPADQEKLERLFDALDEHEAVQDIYSNVA